MPRSSLFNLSKDISSVSLFVLENQALFQFLFKILFFVTHILLMCLPVKFCSRIFFNIRSALYGTSFSHSVICYLYDGLGVVLKLHTGFMLESVYFFAVCGPRYLLAILCSSFLFGDHFVYPSILLSTFF